LKEIQLGAVSVD